MKKTMLMVGLALLAGVGCQSTCNFERKAREGRLSVFDFGAKGDGVTDDTAAIQAGIDYLAARGGGKLYFPYTKNGYLVASPGREFDQHGKIVRAQIIIPAGMHTIQLEGEMPPKILYEYQVRPDDGSPNFVPTRFGSLGNMNVRLHSTWNAPEVTDPKERPWSVISAPEGWLCAGHFSIPLVAMKNLEIRVHLDHEKMYPTLSAANLQNSSRVIIEDCQFCLDDHVGDWDSKKELLENPCHTVGLMCSGPQSDDQILRNVAVQGFKYGIVLSEHSCVEHIYSHNNEYGVCVAKADHPIIIQRLLSQHCQRVLSALPDGTFGLKGNMINIIVNELAFETGEIDSVPVVCNMRYGIWDPDNRMHGHLEYMQGYPGFASKCRFPKKGGNGIRCTAIGETLPADAPQNGILCLTFDDDSFDSWVKMLPVFEKYGAKASFFASGELDAEKLAKLKRIREAGHVVGVHTVNHKEIPNLKPTKAEFDAWYAKEVQPQLDALSSVGIDAKAMAMPFNQHSAAFDRCLYAKGFKRLRVGHNPRRDLWRRATTFANTPTARGESFCGMDEAAFQKFLDRVEYAAESNELLVLFSHDITAAGGQWNCTPEQLERVLALAARYGMQFKTLED